MSATVPILLSFYALSNGTKNLFTGQLTYSSLRDFSFISYSPRKTFRTLLALYRTRFFANKHIILHFDHGSAVTKTDASGSFFFIAETNTSQTHLKEISLSNGQTVRIIKDLYTCKINHVDAPFIVVSDIDDTLLHSHISNKLLKFRTLMFTSMEKRKAVTSMMKLIRDLHESGAASFYLSNSEQNLYPLIYRFLIHNGFPSGPLFLRQMRKVRDIFRFRSFEARELHKTKMLHEIIKLFPEKKFFLLGDNTQLDLKIYLKIAAHYPENIRYIIIRKVLSRSHDEAYLKDTEEKLKAKGIGFYYANTFPSTFEL
ncbi:App1 family protein [Chryseolinea sp. H1M3-3]|uniref:App1 family protein n=1 Tax=Chryseolinea sp. H1M3-3 TaxID=3034144 RepID=UPI0023EAC100|nr:App1 family protein [Chryseolinea sp. H1M3-3]